MDHRDVLTVSLFHLFFLSASVTPVGSSTALKECWCCKNTRTTTERCKELELVFASGSDKRTAFTLQFMGCYGWCFLDCKPLCSSDRTFSYTAQRELHEEVVASHSLLVENGDQLMDKS